MLSRSAISTKCSDDGHGSHLDRDGRGLHDLQVLPEDEIGMTKPNPRYTDKDLARTWILDLNGSNRKGGLQERGRQLWRGCSLLR